MTSPAAQIGEGERIVLDTSILIAYLKGNEVASPAAIRLLEELVASGRNPAWISSVSVAEVLVQPLRERGRVPSGIKSFLLDFEGLSVRSADFLVAAEAAEIRAKTGASLPDALVAATATVTSSRWLVTNDLTLKARFAGLDWHATVVALAELSV